jgi:hypothetical protein
MWWEMRKGMAFKEFGELRDDNIGSSRGSIWSNGRDGVSGWRPFRLGRGWLGDNYDALFTHSFGHDTPELGLESRVHRGRSRIEKILKEESPGY